MAALNMSEVETLIGIDFAIDALPLGDSDKVVAAFDLEPTWANRQLLARSMLDEERQKRAAAGEVADREG